MRTSALGAGALAASTLEMVRSAQKSARREVRGTFIGRGELSPRGDNSKRMEQSLRRRPGKRIGIAHVVAIQFNHGWTRINTDLPSASVAIWVRRRFRMRIVTAKWTFVADGMSPPEASPTTKAGTPTDR